MIQVLQSNDDAIPFIPYYGNLDNYAFCCLHLRTVVVSTETLRFSLLCTPFQYRRCPESPITQW